MTKLLVIADDLTGALDTGVQFAKRGIAAKVVRQLPCDRAALALLHADVLVISAESRPMDGAQAYDAVYALAAQAVALGIPNLYKKTDSGLRGNIGKELEAALAASGQRHLTFIPALPAMNRVTIDGMHYIDGTPIHESVFGQDPFEPVRSARVADLFGGVNVPVRSYSTQDAYQRGSDSEIGIFDAGSDEDIQRIMDTLSAQNKLGVMAGCAGFAGVIASGMQPEEQPLALQPDSPSLLIISGSVNGITGQQITYAARHGVERVTLTPEQQLDPSYLASPEGQQRLYGIKQKCEAGITCIIETGAEDAELTGQYLAQHGISLYDARSMIAGQLGQLLKLLLDMGLKATIMIIGGDTLAGVLSRIAWDEIAIYHELAPGAVLASVMIGGSEQWFITKSGGFGTPDTLVDIKCKIKKGANRLGAKEAAK